MLFGQSVRHLLPALAAAVNISAAHLAEEHVYQIKLGDAGRYGTQLERPLLSAALEHHIRIRRAGGLGEAGNQDGACPPFPGSSLAHSSSSRVEPE